MVKVLLRWENIKCLFRKDIGIVGILWWEGDFILVGGDGEFGGKGGLLDVFFVKGDALFYPINMRIFWVNQGIPKAI